MKVLKCAFNRVTMVNALCAGLVFGDFPGYEKIRLKASSTAGVQQNPGSVKDGCGFSVPIRMRKYRCTRSRTAN
jgi:hypothetical protein